MGEPIEVPEWRSGFTVVTHQGGVGIQLRTLVLFPVPLWVGVQAFLVCVSESDSSVSTAPPTRSSSLLAPAPKLTQKHRLFWHL